jgi:putative transposase
LRDVLSVIKLEIRLSELPKAIAEFKRSRKEALERLSQDIRDAVGESFNQILNTEIDIFLGSESQKDNKRNGYHPVRDYTIKGLGTIRIRRPKDRMGRFNSVVIPAKERVDPRIKVDMAMLQLAGLSSRTLAMISRRLLGIEYRKDAANECLGLVSEEAQAWLSRPIQGNYFALYVDGTNFKVQRRGSTQKEPSLVVLGIDESYHRSILAIEPGHKDNVESWRAVFSSLKERGLDTASVRLGVMDGLPGLEALFKDCFPNARTQRCWVHSLGNALAKTPARMRQGFKLGAHRIMYANSEDAARLAFKELKELMGTDAQRAIRCLEKDLDSLLSFFHFDRSLWVALRTTNAIETINRQFKRKTRGMDTLGEQTLESILAFTALKIELGWGLHRVDSKIFTRHLRKEELNTLEEAATQMNLPH